MKTLIFTINITASPEKVWHALWNEDSFKKWTNPFCQGSYYKTDSFTQGNKIHLLTPDGRGMYSILEKIDAFKFLAFKHIGNIENFEEMPLDEETKAWTNALETYQLTEGENGTVLTVKADTAEKYIDYMNKTFPLALLELKHICEQ